MRLFNKDTWDYFLGATFGLNSVCAALYLAYLITTEPSISLGDYIQSLLFVVAAITLFVTLKFQTDKREYEESESFLNKSIALAEHALAILTNDDGTPTNDRVSWVSAARLLQRSENISEQISIKHHQVIYESERDYLRHKFNSLLSPNGDDLPCEFYFGPKCVPGDIGQSAISSLNKTDGVEWLNTTTISVVYKYKSFPKEYHDPLDGAKSLSDKEIDDIRLFKNNGLSQFFLFRKKFLACYGTLYKIEKGKEPIEANPIIINQEMQRIKSNNWIK